MKVSAVVVALLMAAPAAGAAIRYSITDLGVLPGATNSVATAINSHGMVVGFCSFAGGLTERGFAWANGVMTNPGTLPGGDYVTAKDVNGTGEIVGTGNANGAAEPRGFFLDASGMTDLARSFGGANIHANGVNDAARCVGEMTRSGSGDPAKFRGVLWEKDPAHPDRFLQTVLPVLTNATDPTLTFTLANDVNNGGVIAGSGYTYPEGQRGVLWLGDAQHTIIDLGKPPGASESFAVAVNDSGTAVGYDTGPFFRQRALLWSNDTTHTWFELDLLPGTDLSAARAINNLGHVVGASSDTNGLSRAFLWRDGVLFDLNTLLDASGAAWQLRNASGINDAGQIVGTGLHNGTERAFLLTPLPNVAVALGANVTLTWNAVPGARYRVQSTSNLPISSWTDLSGEVVAASTTASAVDPVSPIGGSRFYRVQLLP